MWCIGFIFLLLLQIPFASEIMLRTDNPGYAATSEFSFELWLFPSIILSALLRWGLSGTNKVRKRQNREQTGNLNININVNVSPTKRDDNPEKGKRKRGE